MKKKSSKLRKLENNRSSIITEDLTHCVMCGGNSTDLNEIFMGKNRQASMRFDLCIPLCRTCHIKYHNNRQIQLYWMNIGIKEFLKTHTIEEFRQNFYYVKGLDIY